MKKDIDQFDNIWIKSFGRWKTTQSHGAHLYVKFFYALAVLFGIAKEVLATCNHASMFIGLFPSCDLQLIRPGPLYRKGAQLHGGL